MERQKNIIAVGLLAIAVSYFVSCNSSSDKEAPQQNIDTTTVVADETVDTVLAAETFRFFTRPNVKQSSVAYRMVETRKEDSLLTSKFEPKPDYYKKYSEFIRFSPDSTRFIDFGSYHVDVTINKNGEKKYEELGPDSEVSLIDPSASVKKRLLFLGPAGVVDDAAWVDNETIVIAGRQEGTGIDSLQPVIWKFHIPTNTFYQYAPQK